MTNTINLLKAAIIIAQLNGMEVTAIQFEDGSGLKFNYQLNNSGQWLFIDFGVVKLNNVYYHQMDIINEVERFKVLPTTYNGLFTKQSS
jgi:hypothetical protein